MKKFYFFILTSCLLSLSSFAQTLIPVVDELVLPQYAYVGSNANSRLQYVCRLKISTGSTGVPKTYRYFVGMSSLATTSSQTPGSMFQIRDPALNVGRNILGFTNTKAIGGTSQILANGINYSGSVSQYGVFVTDANGDYTGWFACVPTNSTNQTVGQDVYFYVQTSNGAGGTSLTNHYRTTSTIKLLDYNTTSGSATGLTAIVGDATATVGNEKFVSLYDNDAATGRPLYTTYTERDSINLTTVAGQVTVGNSWSTWYGAVEGVLGGWGAVIPNNLTTGVRVIRYSNIDGSTIGSDRTSPDGLFGAVNTVNPSGGTTPINLDPTTLPIQLTSFTGQVKDFGVRLNWTTSQESNNQYFELFRAGDDRNFTSIGRVNGAVNSSVNKTYSFDDISPLSGTNYYQLKQVDLDGKSTSFTPIAVKFGLAEDGFKLLSSSESSVVVSISSAVAKEGTISYIGLDGRVLYKQQVSLSSGVNSISIPVDQSTGRIGVINFTSGNEQKSLKVSR